MAHPYTSAARIKALVASGATYAGTAQERLLELLDRNADGTEDVSGLPASETLVANYIERACNRIDGEVGQVYVVPLNVSLADPAASGLVSDIADQLAAAWLYFWIDPESPDGKRLEADALSYLDMVRARRVTFPGQTPVPQTTGRNAVRCESIGVQAAGGLTNGRTDNPFTDCTVDLTRGL